MSNQNITPSAFEFFLQGLVMEGYTPYFITAGLCLIVFFLAPIYKKVKAIFLIIAFGPILYYAWIFISFFSGKIG